MTAPLRPADEPATTFVRRHIGPSPRDIAAMLETVGAASLKALMGETLPSSIRQKAPLDLGRALSETEALAHMRELASKNQVFTSLIGQGYSGTILPAVIQRNILENPAWYTAYTPYQPEISQGRLEALFNFQTMICDLTGPRCRQRLAARRGDGGGRSDGARRARRAGQDKIVLRRRRGASADAGRAAHPRRAAGLESCRRRSPERSRQGGRVRRAAAISGHLGRGARSAPGDRGAARQGRARGRRRRSAGADAAGLAGRTRRRHRDRIGAALRRADGLWRAARGLYGGARRAEALAAGAHRRACRSIRGGSRPIGWRCRPASSISAARRRLPTSAPRRCCWPSSPRCMRSITARKD